MLVCVLQETEKVWIQCDEGWRKTWRRTRKQNQNILHGKKFNKRKKKEIEKNQC